MPALQVRDFPDDLYARLKESAAKNHRSIAQQTIAFVEAQLDQEEKRGAFLAPDFQNPPVPQNIRDAVAQTRYVDPFDWLHDFEEEPEEVIAARREKRRKLREQARELSKAWIGPKPSPDEIAEMIREEREARTDRILRAVEESREEMRKKHDGA